MSDLVWCEHCQRIYAGNASPTAPLTRCPFCDGSGFDQFPLEVLRREYQDVPESPAVGAYYTPRRILEIIDPCMGSGAFLSELASNPPWGQS